MKNVKRLLLVLAADLMLAQATPVIVSAAVPTDTVYYPQADVIVTKVRVHNGKMQYRHWNATRNYWIEADWIDY